MKKDRGSFTGGIGFVLAAAGSAVGLGNLWRFPYLAAQYGGGIFILVYIILTLTFGFALMTTEIAIGRKTQKSAILAYGLIDKRFSFLGYLAIIVPLIILPYYSVIGGWLIKYMAVFLSGDSSAASNNNYFSDFTGSTWWPLFLFALFLGITSAIVATGVEKGIEKISKVLMPILIVIIFGICIYVISLPGSVDGVKYYILPDISKFSFKTVCAAMGQLFYSMSIAMGIMITYGSYTSRQVSLTKSVNQIEMFDTVVAFVAGLIIVTSVFIFSGKEGLEASGPELMFVSMPKIFSRMAGGDIVGALFFLLVMVAALTSSVSIMEAFVASIMDKFKLGRVTACVMTFLICLLLGIPSSLGFGIWSDIKILGMDFLTFFDYIGNSVVMPIVALLTCIMIGWFTGTRVITDEVTRNGEVFRRRQIYIAMVKYIAPVLLLIILVVYSLAQFGIITL